MSSPGCGRPVALATTVLAAVMATTAACVVQVDGVPAGPQPSTSAVSTHAVQPPGSTRGVRPAENGGPSPRRVGPWRLARLPEATTHGMVRGAPKDWRPRSRPSGLLVHPKQLTAVFARPGGQAIAALPARQLGAPTWVPVIEQRPGWVRVLLPARPNGVTGWLPDDGLDRAQTPYWITVDRKRFRLTLHRAGGRSRSWTVGVGKPSAVTPPGRTFVLANVHDASSKFSTTVLPLGVHSDTFRTYGGGPGTVGIHTWPTPDVFGKASSDGCIRIARGPLRLLARTVPLGTPVLVR